MANITLILKANSNQFLKLLQSEIIESPPQEPWLRLQNFTHNPNKFELELNGLPSAVLLSAPILPDKYLPKQFQDSREAPLIFGEMYQMGEILKVLIKWDEWLDTQALFALKPLIEKLVQYFEAKVFYDLGVTKRRRKKPKIERRKEDRQSEVLKLIQEGNHTQEEMAEILDCSVETIKRDFKALERNGKLTPLK